MLVIALCFAYTDELPPAREKPSFDLIFSPHHSWFFLPAGRSRGNVSVGGIKHLHHSTAQPQNAPPICSSVD